MLNYDSCSDVQYVQYHYDVGGMQRCNWKEIGVYKDIVQLIFYFLLGIKSYVWICLLRFSQVGIWYMN